MKHTWNRITSALRRSPDTEETGTPPARRWNVQPPSPRALGWLAGAAAVVAAGALVAHNPPVRQLAPGELGVRVNLFTGTASQWRDGGVWVLPGLHYLRVFSLRDQT